MSTSDTVRPTTLRGVGDWSNWRIGVTAKLAAKECFSAITPFPSKPSSTLSETDKAAIKTFQDSVTPEIRLKAYGHLMSHIDPTLYTIFGEAELDPLKIVQALYDHFFLNTSSNLVALSSEFNRLSMQTGESTSQFAGRIETIANNMAALGGKLQEHQITARFLDGLVASNPAWETFQQILDTRAALGDARTYAEIKLSAATYETSIRRHADNTVLMANKPTMHCDRCGKDGHIAAKCWDTECIKPPRDLQGPRIKRPPPSPCTCGEMHWRSDCPQKKSNDKAYIAQQPPTTFVLDTGATCHIVNKSELIVDPQPCNTYITGIGGQKAAVTANGSLKDFPGACNLVPGSQENIISIKQLTSNGWTATFANGNALLESPHGRKIIGTQIGDLYRIDDTCYIATDAERHASDMYKWHCNFGHIRTVARLRNTAATYGIDISKWPAELPHCTACVEGSSTRARISRKTSYADVVRGVYKPGQRLHADLVGPLDTGDYALDVTDEATRYEMVEFINSKDKAAPAMAKLIDVNYTRHQVDPEEFHTDRGGEFIGRDWQQLCRDLRVRATYTAANTPEHNGIAERTHGVSINMARAMLAAAGLDPKKFGHQAYRHAVYVRNMSTTRTLEGKTPYELWQGTTARVDNLLPFGTRVFYYTDVNSKFGKRAAPGLYMGPAQHTVGNAIRVHSLETGREVITRSYQIDKPGLQSTVTQLQTAAGQPTTVPEDGFTDLPDLIYDSESEDEGIDTRAPADRPERTTPTTTPTVTPAPTTAPTTQSKPTSREAKALGNITAAGFNPLPEQTRTRSQARTAQGEHANHGHVLLARAVQGEHAVTGQVLLAISSSDGPHTYKQAMAQPDAAEWTTALQGELVPLLEKSAFSIMPASTMPSHQRPIRSRYVFTRKTDENDIPTTRKARLVACGYSQVHGVDFFDVSAPVVTKDAMRTLFAVAAHKGLHMLQFDFEKAYINADLDTDIYMRAPDGFADILGDYLTPEQYVLLTSGKAILKLNKALYGLKQSGLLWYTALREYLISIGFKQCETDPCVFYDSRSNIIFVHVDDGIIFAASNESARAIYELIKQRYDVKYLGQPKSIVGLSIERYDNGSIFVHQRAYCESMGEKFAPGQPGKGTPMADGAALNPDSTPGDKQLYPEMTGTLLFAAVCTRPDIACAVSMESRFIQNPSKAHMTFARNTISYAASTANYGLLFKPASDIKIEVFCDASFASDEDRRKSRSGYIIMVNGTPVSWKSALQPIIAFSTAEAEYISMSDAVRDAMFIRRLLQELGYDITGPITVYEDNQTAKTIAEEIATKRSKYIDLRYHHIRHLVASGAIKIEYIRSSDQLADVLTKALPKDTFCKLRDRFMAQGEY